MLGQDEGKEEESRGTDFEETKTKFNLLFEQEDYVEKVSDTMNGPFSKCTMTKYDTREEGSLLVGHTMPDSNLFTLEGKAVKLSDFYSKGRPLVLTFGSWS